MKYRCVVQNNDVAEGDRVDIQFHANDKLMQIKPNEKVDLSETVYNILKNNVQIRYDAERKPYEFRRFPVTLIEKIPENEEDKELLELEELEKLEKLEKIS